MVSDNLTRKYVLELVIKSGETFTVTVFNEVAQINALNTFTAKPITSLRIVRNSKENTKVKNKLHQYKIT